LINSNNNYRHLNDQFSQNHNNNQSGKKNSSRREQQKSDGSDMKAKRPFPSSHLFFPSSCVLQYQEKWIQNNKKMNK